MRVSAKIILTHQGKFLLLKPKILVGSVNGWDIPGGTVQDGELSSEALQREVREETNIELKDYVFLKSMIPAGKDAKYEIYFGKSDTKNVILSKEHVKYKWVDSKEFFKLTGFDLNSLPLDK